MRQSRAIQAIIQSLSGNSNGPTASQEQEMCWHQCIDGGGFDNICRDVCY